MTPCRWLVLDELDDAYCVNDAADECGTVPCEEDCKACSHYYSLIDSENVRKIEDGELLDVVM